MAKKLHKRAPYLGKLQSRDHYQVKYPAIELGVRGMRYGIARIYGDDEEFRHFADRGKIVVDGAVFPTAIAVPEKALVDIPFDWHAKTRLVEGFVYGLDEYHDYVTLQHIIHQFRHRSLPTDKLAVGHLFSTGVGDGAAHYCVTKLFKQECQVDWRGFCADRWTDRLFGWGGRFRISDVAALVGLGRRRLFVGPKDLIAALTTCAQEFLEKYGHLPADIEAAVGELAKSKTVRTS